MVEKIESFKTSDGRVFNDEMDAELHESQHGLRELLLLKGVTMVDSMITLIKKEEPGAFNDGTTVSCALSRWLRAQEAVRRRDATRIKYPPIDRSFLDPTGGAS